MDRCLAELDADDQEHPDTWLESRDSGYALLAFTSGAVVLERPEGDGTPRHLLGVPRAEVKRLWLVLAHGDVAELLKLPWQPGYP
jgi:hypothetical protein